MKWHGGKEKKDKKIVFQSIFPNEHDPLCEMAWGGGGGGQKRERERARARLGLGGIPYLEITTDGFSILSSDETIYLKSFNTF